LSAGKLISCRGGCSSEDTITSSRLDQVVKDAFRIDLTPVGSCATRQPR